MSKYIETHAELLKLHNRKVTCKIYGDYVDDAKISVAEDSIAICQNERDSNHPEFDKLGYGYCMFLSHKNNKYENNRKCFTEIQLKYELDFDLKEKLLSFGFCIDDRSISYITITRGKFNKTYTYDFFKDCAFTPFEKILYDFDKLEKQYLNRG